MKYNRTELGGNIGFSTVIDSKFKTNSISIRFITELEKGTAADNTIGMGVLTTSTSTYKTLAVLSEKLSELYGASLSSSAKKRGDIQILGVNASWISNKYAFDGEDVTGEMLDIVCGALFSPNADNGEFDKDSFDITKKDLLDKIEAEINNKRGYALAKAAEIAFRGEPAENSCYDTKESAEKVTSASAYRAYRKLLENARVEVFYVAPEENSAVMERIKEEFAKISRTPKEYCFENPSKAKDSVERASEELDVNQCKMVMAFKTDSTDLYAVKLMSIIYGGTPVSKLFTNVREKLSLCYYCACRTIASKSAMFVDSGVEKANIEKAENEILFQLDEIRNGNFSDEEVESALLSIDNSLSGVGDTTGSYISWYFERMCDGEVITPHQQYERFLAVTRERIIEAAKSVKLDSVYLMLNKEEAK